MNNREREFKLLRPYLKELPMGHPDKFSIKDEYQISFIDYCQLEKYKNGEYKSIDDI